MMLTTSEENKLLFIAFAILFLSDGISGSPCQLQNVGGSLETLQPVSSQTGHGAGSAGVVFDPTYFKVQCCGVIQKWEVLRYDVSPDGCTAGTVCNMDFLVWDTVDPVKNTANLVGTNLNYPVPKAVVARGISSVVIPASDAIPVKAGDMLGWNGPLMAIDYSFDDGTGVCAGSTSTICTFYYFTRTPNFSGLTIGNTYGFTFSGYSGKQSLPGFRAVIYEGNYPIFSNLPGSVTIPTSTSVKTVVFTVSVSDLDSKQKLTTSLTSVFPATGYFSLDTTTGNVILEKSLASGPYYFFTLSIEVSDTCLTNSSFLHIFVQDVTTSTVAPTTTSMFQTTTGLITLIMIALAFLLSTLVAIGICIVCCKLTKNNPQEQQNKT